MFEKPVKTAQEIAKDKAIQSLKKGEEIIATLRTKTIADFKFVWENENVTPQQAIDAYGTEAIKVFKAHYATQLYLKALDPTWEMLIPGSYTENEDGSITII